jgi:RNA-directed DNA polymerase
MPNRAFVAALAKAFLSGDRIAEQVIARASLMLAGPPKWLTPLARRFVKAFPPGKIRPRHRDVVEFLLKTSRFRRRKPAVGNWLTEPPRMQPAAAAQSWPIPTIETSGALAEWLQLTLGELEWLADLKGLSRNYHVRALPKPGGAIRLVEAPKPRLKELQRKILAEILEKVPPHPAVHGFLKGHSIKTFVAPHVSQRVVLKMDLEDFFPSISGPRVQALFRTMGYPEAVADILGGICTTQAPREYGIYSRPHLPQGAPTSPALANLCAYRVDCRLTGLAKSADAIYTRYADDLAFSGGEEFERCVKRFSTHVASILQEDGFSVHHRKTRVMRQSVRQHLAGLVANERLNIRRTDFDRLKATLTNCIRLGPASQNHDAHPHFRLHLQGRVAFVESIHPDKGSRLRRLFGRIAW